PGRPAAPAAHARGAGVPGEVGGMTRLTVPDPDERNDLGAFVARVVRLDQAALVRLVARDGMVTAWAATPFDVPATRTVHGPPAACSPRSRWSGPGPSTPERAGCGRASCPRRTDGRRWTTCRPRSWSGSPSEGSWSPGRTPARWVRPPRCWIRRC